MLKMKTTKFKEEGGEVMLEASIILVAILILLMALLSITFMFYEQAVMTSIATEIASDVAKNVKFSNLEIGTSTITPSDYDDTQMFRTNFGQFSLQDDKEALAKTYARERMRLASFGMNSGTLEVECNLKVSGIGRMYAVVTVSRPTEFFLSGVLDLLGITDTKTMFSVTAYAECTDLMGYSAMVNFADYATTKLEVFGPFADFYVSFKKYVQTLLG